MKHIYIIILLTTFLNATIYDKFEDLGFVEFPDSTTCKTDGSIPIGYDWELSNLQQLETYNVDTTRLIDIQNISESSEVRIKQVYEQGSECRTSHYESGVGTVYEYGYKFNLIYYFGVAYNLPPCGDEVPEGAVAYPQNDDGSCKTYEGLLIEVFSQAGAKVCDGDCFSFYYTTITCQPPMILEENEGEDFPFCTKPDFTVFTETTEENTTLTPDINTTVIPKEIPDVLNLLEEKKIECGNPNLALFSSSKYSMYDYTYYGKVKSNSECSALLNDNVDDVVVLPDVLRDCVEEKFCYYHAKVNDCYFNPANYAPDGYEYYSNFNTEITCTNSVDGVFFISSSFITPDISHCPGVGFCFLKSGSLKEDDSDINNTNPTTTNLDLKPLLDSQNKTNDTLNDLKKEAKERKKQLDDIKKTNLDILNNNKNMDKTLGKINDNTKKSNDLQKDANHKLDTIDSSLNSLNNGQSDLASYLKGGLFGDNPWSDFEFSDGSETFNELGGDAKESFSILEETNIFGLSEMSSMSLPTYEFNFHGNSITIFEPSMMDNFPIDEIRSLIIFLFAMSGFVQTFKGV